MPAAREHQRVIVRDAVEPGPQAGVWLEALDGFEGGEKGGLHDVLRVGVVAEDASRKPVHLIHMRVEKLGERVRIALLKSPQERRLAHGVTLVVLAHANAPSSKDML